MNNTSSSNLKTLALIAGPTASGKSAIALALAKKVDGVIVNADASQLYQDLQVLTARPDAADMAEVPHRLYGVVNGASACSAADWAELARAEIAAIQAEGRVPILVGGTGLYLKTLLYGIAPVPDIPPEIRSDVRSMATEQAYMLLERHDPDAAKRLNPADRNRIARALEVKLATGTVLHDWQSERAGGIEADIDLHAHVLLPPREPLRAACYARFITMLDNGAEDEVRALLARGLYPELPVMRAIGVREIAAFIDGSTDRESMIENAVNATRQYAKRQFTWFRRQPPVTWQRHYEEDKDEIIRNIETIFQYR